MRKWFGMEMSGEELRRTMERSLTPSQLYLHNRYVNRILRGGLTSCLSKNSNGHCDELNGEADQELLEIDAIPPLMTIERTVLPADLMLERIQHGAKEHQLVKVAPATADYLCAATNVFLKDIITAIICQRRSFKTKHNKFIYGIGSPQLNPWLRNVTQGRMGNLPPLRLKPDKEGFLVPNPRPAREILEQNAAFELAASESDKEKFAPITPIDLIDTLKVHPSLIPSNFVRTVNWERMYSQLYHHTWDY
ncbi:Transcriptional adaptor 1 [Nesidiocoris tenuis]|uniref:Transcriptional adaptor 1 n=1 Tax=Nesidiocoris tenuis TaxID=355587 RepID=A0ABN7AL89_9HEMI|nr:Transcriptional adaptor 1 [Nesidiocoris tenuis]